ncbi:FAD/NAD(P)-binding domain-containing protein [Xylaria intraflava]|nr:FAD/NAD(P)-binding domain-containing protein [Xylaria intraflava]
MASTLYVLAITPFLLARYLLDITLCLLPQGRPLGTWTINQAIRMRTIQLFLFYQSHLQIGDRLELKPGREGDRFEIIQPQPRRLYGGPLDDDSIRPEAIGTTWTPARPSQAVTESPNTTVALHFHGGAFVIGLGRDSDAGYLARSLVRHMGCTHVCAPQYRLSSPKGGRFPAALQDAVTSYLHLIKNLRIPASQIILSGDSAGGNMVLGLLRYISEYGQELDIPAPAAAALWSPWTDISTTLDVNLDIKMLNNHATDFLCLEFPRWGARSITADGAIDALSPYLCPQRHPFRLSADIPVFVNVGSGELLFDDIVKFRALYEDQGWRISLVVSVGCPHDIALLGPVIGFHKEAEAAFRDAKAFFSSTTALRLQVPSDSSPTIDPLDYDVVIVGAGISGINAAHRLQTQGPPGLRYVILEGRDCMGGTWDLFRYPGIRSDSDIFTFGLPWSPWTGAGTIATGDEIKRYLIQSAESAGIDQHIRYRHTVAAADWRSTAQRWVFRVNVAGEEKPIIYKSRFALLGTGYYDYDTPLQTVIPGIENFKGKVIHPQFWPKDYDHTGKDVVIIGSGATAVTILPSIVEEVKCVTMLQRSPTYIFSLPSTLDFLTKLLFAILPAVLAHKLIRMKWIFSSYLTTWICKTFPEIAKSYIKHVTIRQLPPNIKWDPHFKPRYNPWEQRFCASMDGDFYAALRSGKADVVTDKIKTVTTNSIELESGSALHPDVIVTATGLKLKFGGGIQFSKYAWKSAMIEGVPNLLFMVGYEDASWTLGAEQRQANVVKPMMTLSSTYVTSAGKIFPKGGTGQWSPKTNYMFDMASVKWGKLTQDLHFT